MPRHKHEASVTLPPGRTPRRSVSLVLGAGGARGYAHIGAIEVLQERGYEITAVTGSSMGALVGGIFAAGEPSRTPTGCRACTSATCCD